MCGGGHLHKECPERTKDKSPPNCCNELYGEESIHLQRLAAAMRRMKPHETAAAAGVHSEILNRWQIDTAACSSATLATEGIVRGAYSTDPAYRAVAAAALSILLGRLGEAKLSVGGVRGLQRRRFGVRPFSYQAAAVGRESNRRDVGLPVAS
jgi:hypothetical protein